MYDRKCSQLIKIHLAKLIYSMNSSDKFRENFTLIYNSSILKIFLTIQIFESKTTIGLQPREK